MVDRLVLSRPSGCCFWSDEWSSVVGAGRVDCESELVDGDLVVVPAEGDEVVGVVAAAVYAVLEGVGLEPVPAAAAFDRALSLAPPVAEGSGSRHIPTTATTVVN